jgi:hypothetical protein
MGSSYATSPVRSCTHCSTSPPSAPSCTAAKRGSLNRFFYLVFLSTALFAVGLGLLTQVDSVAGFYLVVGILGAAFGIYIGVDLALVLAVLPHPEDNAKDLGVFNIANAALQSLAPFLGAALLSLGAGGKNYTLLYLTAAALTLLGAFAILPVKKVK